MGWEFAVMTMAAIASAGFLIADGERMRMLYVQAMRRCLFRMEQLIRYEQPELIALLQRIDLHATPQEKQLTQLLHATAKRLSYSAAPQLVQVFVGECGKRPSFGVLSEADRSAFENLLGELGRTGLVEQLQLLGAAQERLAIRERELMQEGRNRAKLIRTLGLTGGAAVFLLLI